MPPMRQGDLSVYSTSQWLQKNSGGFLWAQMLWAFCKGERQPELFDGAQSRYLPKKLQGCQERCFEARWDEMLSMLPKGEKDIRQNKSRRSSCRSRYSQQRAMESSQFVPKLSSQAGIASQGYFVVGEEIVTHVEEEVRVQRYVYNVEVSQNKNYFANGILVHNCSHLQAITENKLSKLIINVPPGTSKSSFVSVLWPCWEWIRYPHKRWLFAAHKDKLAERDSLRRRLVISSEWYQARWPLRFAEDERQKRSFINEKTGYMLSLSVAGDVTGVRGDRLVLDDPNSATEMESEAEREAALLWFDLQWSTRRNDGAAEVIVQQRTHEQDFTGHALRGGGWTHLRVPMEFEQSARAATGLGWADPRNAEGELLDQARFPAAAVEELKMRLGPYGAAGQLQQTPYPRGGGMFQIARLRERTVGRRPEKVFTMRGWDLAATEKRHSKRTAGVRMSKDVHGRYYIEHVVLGKWTPDKRNEIMKAATDADGDIKVLFEHEGGSGGEDQALSIIRLLAGHRVEAIKVSGDKVARADAFAAQVNAGNVWLVADGTWNADEFLRELEAFPNGTYCDEVDAASLAFNRLAPINVSVAARRPTPEPATPLAEAARIQAEALGGPAGDWRRGFGNGV